VGRWTAEENRHAIAIRDYLVATRGVDPQALEQARMTHMTAGVSSAALADDRSPDGALSGDAPVSDPGANPFMRAVAYVTFQELATRVSHRNTGAACADPIADRLLKRIAADENLHMVFYRNLTAAALDLAPDQALRGITDVVSSFRMPGLTQPDFRRNAVLLAKHGIYDLRQHLDEVIQPVLRHWRVFQRTDFGPAGERLRETLAAFLVQLQASVVRFEETRDRALAREARRRPRHDGK
jgi:acyl-[acyl-carrier-protein] desaturase